MSRDRLDPFTHLPAVQFVQVNSAPWISVFSLWNENDNISEGHCSVSEGAYAMAGVNQCQPLFFLEDS